MDTNNFKVRLDAPYPQIVNASPNPKTVAVLKDLNAGRNGELTGIFQYFYQHVLSEKPSADIAKIFEEIAIVEMVHSELLSEATLAFGGNPVNDDSKGIFFNASYPNYTQKLVDMLNANIQLEEKTIVDYSASISLVDNESLKSLFARIIEDEKLHLQIFKDLRASVKFFSL